MLIRQNFLRVIRKQSLLTQADIATILRISDHANVSRWEQGHKTPNVEVLLVYHLLFDIPVEALFERQKEQLKPIILPRIRERITALQGITDEPKTEGRIRSLETILARLSA